MAMTQESIFHFFMDNALEIALLFEKNGKIIYANESAKQQLSDGEEWKGCLISDIFPAVFEMTDSGLRANCSFGQERQEMMAYRKNKTCFPVKTRMLQYGEEPQAYLCVAYDISERNMLEKKITQAGQEAEEALKVKSEFVANVTHELRTPVNGILGNVQELLSIETEKQKLQLLHLLERGCADMNTIINSILDFSKLEAGKFTLEPREFNFRNMIDYVKSNHLHKITEKGLDFFVTISPGVPECIIGDELRIVQILNNLLSNACKFTSVGKIMLEVVKTAQYDNRVELFFMVIDSGIGIDKTSQDKLFRSFSQVDASISRKYGGTGLGLNICKQLVELMDGTIRVESELNKGTMFSFHIWVEIPQEELSHPTENADVNVVMHKLKSLSQQDNNENIWRYGEPENLEEIKKKMSKLILSVEMENWEKAVTFADTIRQLTEEAPKEVKTAVLRLKMGVQKENYEKAVTAFEALQSLL